VSDTGERALNCRKRFIPAPADWNFNEWYPNAALPHCLYLVPPAGWAWAKPRINLRRSHRLGNQSVRIAILRITTSHFLKFTVTLKSATEIKLPPFVAWTLCTFR
jgi:hypothetical protein